LREVRTGDVVRSLRGRDKGLYFFVLAAQKSTVTITDGKYRKLASPKTKNKRHIIYVSTPDCRVRNEILSGEIREDAHIRKALSAVMPDCF